MSNASSDSKKLPWNVWWGIVFALLVFFAAQVIADLLVSIYPQLQHWNNTRANNWLDNSVPAQFIYVILAEAITVGAIFMFIKQYKAKLADIGLKKPHWSDPFLSLPALAVYFVTYIVAVAIISHLVPGLNVNEKQQVGFDNVHGAPQLIMTFISLVILPPLAEEIMVRGFIYGTLRKALKIIPAALITSLLFAAAHLPEGGSSGPLYIAAIDTFILSMVLISLREITGNLWAGICLHALKNGIAFAALFIGTAR